MSTSVYTPAAPGTNVGASVFGLANGTSAPPGANAAHCKTSASPSGSVARATGVTATPTPVVMSGPAETTGNELIGAAGAMTSMSNSATTTSGGSGASTGIGA